MPNENEELALQLIDMLEVALYFAGVKKSKLQEAVDIYIESLDEIFDEQDDEMRFDEIVKTIKYMQKNHSNLFIKK